MVFLDSDIVLYLRDPKWGEALAKRLSGTRIATCNAVIAEVLSFKGLGKSDLYYFSELLATMSNQPFNEEVTRTVVDLRKSYELAMTDAIVAATAMVNDLAFWTHNTAEFGKIHRLHVFDPIVA